MSNETHDTAYDTAAGWIERWAKFGVLVRETNAAHPAPKLTTCPHCDGSACYRCEFTGQIYQ